MHPSMRYRVHSSNSSAPLNKTIELLCSRLPAPSTQPASHPSQPHHKSSGSPLNPRAPFRLSSARTWSCRASPPSCRGRGSKAQIATFWGIGWDTLWGPSRAAASAVAEDQQLVHAGPLRRTASHTACSGEREGKAPTSVSRRDTPKQTQQEHILTNTELRGQGQEF